MSFMLTLALSCSPLACKEPKIVDFTPAIMKNVIFLNETLTDFSFSRELPSAEDFIV